ncbi:MAG: DMT family transporter [Phyllobacterium sp.]
MWNSAPVLLLLTGALLGLTLPFGKIAAETGIFASLWAFVISGGAGIVLLAALVLMRKRPSLNWPKLRYYMVVAAISYVIPNLLILEAIPRLGAGYTGIMYTVSPILTLLITVILRQRRPNLLGVAGIVVGFIGALMVALTRGHVGQPADPVWIGIAFLIPLCLAVGNVYRTLDWPQGADPLELAAGSHLMAALMLVGMILFQSGGFPAEQLAAVPWLAVAQVAASAGTFALFFRLQQVGGPVYLSQIGYVAAAIGLFSGVAFLGESYRLLTWAGAVIIALGVIMTTRAQSRG